LLEATNQGSTTTVQLQCFLLTRKKMNEELEEKDNLLEKLYNTQVEIQAIPHFNI